MDYEIRCVTCSYAFNGREVPYRAGQCCNCWEPKFAVKYWRFWFEEQWFDFCKDSSALKETSKIAVNAYRENYLRDMRREMYDGLRTSRPAFTDRGTWNAWAQRVAHIILTAGGRRTSPRVPLEIPGQVRLPLFKFVEQEKTGRRARRIEA